jgi:hypothetical protein
VATTASPLPHADRIQRLFGRHDVSSVQAHVGPDASASARAMGAQAYATGNHVVLGEGSDLHTAAHEAAHVVQQRAGVALKGGVGEIGDPYERHADAVADAVVAGRPAAGLLDQMAPGSGAAGGMIQRKVYESSGDDRALPPEQLRLDPRWAAMNEYQRTELIYRAHRDGRETRDEAFVAANIMWREEVAADYRLRGEIPGHLAPYYEHGGAPPTVPAPPPHTPPGGGIAAAVVAPPATVAHGGSPPSVAPASPDHGGPSPVAGPSTAPPPSTTTTTSAPSADHDGEADKKLREEYDAAVTKSGGKMRIAFDAWKEARNKKAASAKDKLKPIDVNNEGQLKALWGGPARFDKWERATAIREMFTTAGYACSAPVESTTSSSTTPPVLFEVQGHPTINQFEIHPGGGIHAAPYIRVSSNRGLIKVINNGLSTVYDPLGQTRAIYVDVAIPE